MKRNENRGKTTMNQEMKLAVLIDAENISSKYIDVILSEANNLGNARLQTNLRQLDDAPDGFMAQHDSRQRHPAHPAVQQYDPQKFIGLGPHHRHHGFIVPEQSRRILHRIIGQ
mgnify:CR=1 FL=1